MINYNDPSDALDRAIRKGIMALSTTHQLEQRSMTRTYEYQQAKGRLDAYTQVIADAILSSSLAPAGVHIALLSAYRAYGDLQVGTASRREVAEATREDYYKNVLAKVREELSR